MKKTLIFTLGAGRSGSTMLNLMLGNDDDSFSLGEVHAWFRPFRCHHFQMDCNCGNPNCPYWKQLLTVKENRFHASAFTKLHKNFLIDSSKNLAWVIDSNQWAIENDFQVINLVIYKPIENYIYSIWKRGESIDAALKRYKTYYGRLLQLNLPIISLPYSDLVSDTDEVLKTLCAITGQQFSPNKKEFWTREFHHLFGSGGIREQSRSKNSSIFMKEVFSDEFAGILPEIRTKISNDKNLQKINDFLIKNDYKSFERKNPISKDQDIPVIVKPLWYYMIKLQLCYRRWIPEKYEPK